MLGLATACVARLLNQRHIRAQATVIAAGVFALGLLWLPAAWSYLRQEACAVIFYLVALALEAPGSKLRRYYSMLIVVLTGSTIYQRVSGGMLTLSWGLEGIGLLTAGFILRERTLRLGGLALLVACIGKVFVYDLSSLETPYRILSFLSLGAILLTVSLIYTRFKEKLQKYL
jgi:uncharacterized membrane protein